MLANKMLTAITFRSGEQKTLLEELDFFFTCNALQAFLCEVLNRVD